LAPELAISNSLDVKDRGFGRVVLHRRQYIAQWCTTIREEQSDGCQHYFWAPQGSGKSCFLLLLGVALIVTGGYDVYYFDSLFALDTISEADFYATHTANRARNVRTVMLLDEAQNPDKSGRMITFLLKNDKASDVIVIAVGLSCPQRGQSPSFRESHKHNPCDICLQTSELPELADAWIAKLQERNIACPPEQVLEFCGWVHKFTGGQLYPILKICDHMFSNAQHSTTFADHFARYRQYILSSAFCLSEACLSIRSRCYDAGMVTACENVLKLGKLSAELKDNLESYGCCDSGSAVSCDAPTGWFVSDLLLCIAYNTRHYQDAFCLTPGRIIQLKNLPVQMRIMSLIVAGLRTMQLSDLVEGQYDVDKMENAIGMLWAMRIHDVLPGVFICPQTRAESGLYGKTKPTVNFTFDSGMDVTIEVSKNSYDIPGKLAKFRSPKGCYREWNGKCAIFNIITRKGVPKSADEMVYHFECHSNTLFRGAVPVVANVSSAYAISAKKANHSGKTVDSSEFNSIMRAIEELLRVEAIPAATPSVSTTTVAAIPILSGRLRSGSKRRASSQLQPSSTADLE
jgi:hypothetical protein